MFRSHVAPRGSTLTIVCACLMLAACRSAPEPRPALAAPSTYRVPSHELQPPMMLQQRLRGRYGDKDFAFDCVLQVSQGKLTIVGLTPFGSRAFVLTQVGVDHTFEKLVDRALPFDPGHILDDVQRVFFRGLPSGTNDGVREGVQGQERVRERWSSGVLTERTFERLDGDPAGVIRVTYGGPKAPLVSTYVTIDNGWYGYRLDIESIVQQSLSEPARP